VAQIVHVTSGPSPCLSRYRMLVPNKMEHIICTGNVGFEQYNELMSLAPHVHVVAGDYEDPAALFPETQVLQVGQFRIGVMHGHQILPYGSKEAIARMRRKLAVDIFISGFTHQNAVILEDGHFHINPGSITGAMSAQSEIIKPSFVLLAIQDDRLVCYLYELEADGEVDVSKTEFTKQTVSPRQIIL
jgi:vacuolar protein sorting-associated protein 29